MFFAYDYDATPGFNVGYAVRRNVEWLNGGYAARIADNDLEFHFHSQTDGQAQNVWMNAYSRELGYNSFIVTRHSDGRVRAYVNGEDLGDPTTEDIAPDELVEPHSGTGNFRVNTSTEVNGRMLTAWISRGVSVHRREAAAMHNDPWAIFRPRI